MTYPTSELVTVLSVPGVLANRGRSERRGKSTARGERDLVNLLACQTTRLHFPAPPCCNTDFLGDFLMPTGEFHRDMKVQGCFMPSRQQTGRGVKAYGVKSFSDIAPAPTVSRALGSYYRVQSL
jgi:hypothetical protein